MQIFLDTAEIEAIRKWAATGVVLCKSFYRTA